MPLSFFCAIIMLSKFFLLLFTLAIFFIIFVASPILPRDTSQRGDSGINPGLQGHHNYSTLETTCLLRICSMMNTYHTPVHTMTYIYIPYTPRDDSVL